ncbi:MAG: hypothetical protein K1X64_11695 [Myxococcaceae bacterium]|nr:hypothetical protein [Myxococcaceae bacterium]
MHPLIARYMPLQAALEVWGRAEQGAPLEGDDAVWLAVARERKDLLSRVLKAKGRTKPPHDTEQALLLIAACAAARVLQHHDALKEPAAQTVRLLKSEGADDAEVEELLATILLEEALAYDAEPDTFDAEYVAETLNTLPALAKGFPEPLDALLETFGQKATGALRPAHLAVAETLFDIAWGEGLVPLSPEHLDTAIDALGVDASASEAAQTFQTLSQLLGFLHEQGVLGPDRYRRLHRLLEHARLGDGMGEDDEDDDEDERVDDERTDEQP